jgi:PAS domain S-box-containing protein
MGISRRRDTEELLLEQLESVRSRASGVDRAIERLTLPAFVHDGVEILAVNAPALGWLGYAERSGALVGRSLGALAHAEDQVALLASVGATSAGPPTTAHLQRFRFANGAIALGEVLARRLPREHRGLTVVVVQPATTTHRGSDRLRLLEAAVDHIPDIVFITEADAIDALGRRVVFVNRAFTRVTGFEPDDVLGKTPNVTVGDATDRGALARIEARLGRRLPVREELEKYGKDGRRYWVELDIVPVFDEDGRHTHWVSVQRDITDRKRLHNELGSPERLASRLAKEVNEPLGGALESLEAIAQRLLDVRAGSAIDRPAVDEELAVVRKGLERARTDAQRARGILRQLAVLAEGPTGRRGEVDVRRLIELAMNDLAAELRVPAAVTCRFENVPPVLVFPDQLGQVLYGLFLDAAHALDPRYAEVNALFVRVASGGDHVVCEIEAMGPGAAAPARSRPRAPGAELGLVVGRSIVRSLGGDLSHHPNPGTGTLHRLRLPIAARERRRHESSERVSPRIRTARVLVLEPDARQAQELRALLLAVNHVVVETGLEGAVRRLKSECLPDVVFCDLSEGSNDGRDLYRIAGDFDGDLPRRFVFIHGKAMPRSLELFLEASKRPHIEKPLAVEEVRASLAAALYTDSGAGH